MVGSTGRQPLLIDVSFARLMELVEARDLADYVTAWRQVAPEAEPEYLELGAGVAGFAGPDCPITQAVGFGLEGPTVWEQIDKVEEFFGSRGAPSRFALCPMAHPSLLGELGRKGYVLSEFEDLLFMELGTGAAADIDGGAAADMDGGAEGLAVRKIGAGESIIWAETAARGFTAVAHPEREDIVLGLAAAIRPGVSLFAAEVGGQMVATAALAVRGEVGTMFGAATLPEFRNRGAQTALTRRLLAAAAEAGCEIAVAGGVPGGVSHRNQERLGLRVAYTKVMVERTLA